MTSCDLGCVSTFAYEKSILSDYVKVLRASPGASVVSEAQRYKEVVERLASNPSFADLHVDDARLLIDRAPKGVRIDSLNDVPASAWPHLVSARRCEPSVGSFAAYLEQYVDYGDWPHLLVAEESLVLDTHDQGALQRAAFSILSMDALDADKRVVLVNALGLDEYLPTQGLSAPAIPLLPELTKAGITADSPDTLDAIPSDQASARRHFIATSAKLADYIDELVLSDSDLLALLESGNQSAIMKLLESPDVLQGASEATMARAIEQANRTPGPVPLRTLLVFAASEPSASQLASLLSREVDRLAAAELRQVLDAMPEPFNSLGRTDVELAEPDRELAEAMQRQGLVTRVQKVRNRPVVRAIAG